MKTTFFQSARRVLGLALGTCAALALSAGLVQAAPGGGGGGANCTITTIPTPPVITAGGSVEFSGSVTGKTPITYSWTFAGGSPASSSAQNVSVMYTTQGEYQATLDGSNGKGQDCSASTTVTVNAGGGNTPPVANNDSATVLVGDSVTINVVANDTDAEDGSPPPVPPATVTILSQPTPGKGQVLNNLNGTVTYTNLDGVPGSDSFTYSLTDSGGLTSNTATVNITVNDVVPPPDLPDQVDFKIMMNYELGMHCTGFEFAYCCVLPAYNSILAQVVKPNMIDPNDNSDYARLMEGDPNEGLDLLNRQTVVRDLELDSNGNFKKYVMKYWHDAQPRNDGRGKPQSSTLISAVEGNSLMAWNTVFDSATVNPASGEPGHDPNFAEGALITGTYNGSDGVMQGDGILGDPADNYQHAIWNHLYIYADPDHPTPAGPNLEGHGNTGIEADKIRLGVNGMVTYPESYGPALHPMGPGLGGPFENLLTFSADTGTIVYTQMKVLEDLPITLTSPRIWEALGLPLTPFEDSIDFFGDPGQVDEDSIRPYVQMKAQLYHYDGVGNDQAVIGSDGNPVIGFGTAPIDIPNCERCHSNGPTATNSPNTNAEQWAMVQEEYAFWNSYYGIDTGAGDSDWYVRLKSAAISMLKGHDVEHGTSFTANYPGCTTYGNPEDTTDCGPMPQNTRLGHESIICQRCHADNVIAAVKSATHSGGVVIPPVTEAIHNNHANNQFADALGRDGGCQGCHPAHRSDGDMSGYPITLGGENFYADGDNRLANGGCFVGRDVHSNPMKDVDGAETPEYLNAVGQWLQDNVARNQANEPGGDADMRGIWCTNCHNQLGQELWKAEDCVDLVNGDCINNPRAGETLADVAAAVGLSEAQAIAMIDPKVDHPLGNFTNAVWAPDPGLCNYVAGYFGVIPVDMAHDGNVATVEVNVTSAGNCSTGAGSGLIDCNAEYPTGGPNNSGAPSFHICGTVDTDGDFSVNIRDFCTTDDCVTAAGAGLPGDSVAVPVPFSAATDGRDHWLSAGEPHCADCHQAPFVEQSGNIDAFPPFNYPRKASLMRYSRGHQDITCQGCHESIHGLYPVTPTIDTTTYAQAASLNHDGSHGPLKCGACHLVNAQGVPSHIQDGLTYDGQPIKEDYDAAVKWAHTFTANADPRDGYCVNCHGDNRNLIASDNRTWTEHSYKGRSSREMMDKAELLQNGHVGGDPASEIPTNTVCTSCHGDRSNTLSRRGCTTKWKNHLVQGRASEEAWLYMSETYAGSNCGW